MRFAAVRVVGVGNGRAVRLGGLGELPVAVVDVGGDIAVGVGGGELAAEGVVGSFGGIPGRVDGLGRLP